MKKILALTGKKQRINLLILTLNIDIKGGKIAKKK